MVRYNSEARSETSVDSNSQEPGWFHIREGDGTCAGEMQRILQKVAMGVSGQRREISLAHDPETDNINAFRKINNKG